eukprot:g1533.t1
MSKQVAMTVEATPAGEVKVSEPTVFEHKEYDVTATCEKFCSCGTASSILFLEADEVLLRNKNCCGQQQKRQPYGELGSVDIVTSCGCCAAFNAGGLAPGVEGAPGAISPGCGCERDLVNEIVEELNRRQRHRGDVGQMKRADEQARNVKVIGERLQTVEAKIDALMKHLSVPQPVVMIRNNE